MARTMALWGFNKFVVILLAGAAVEMIVRDELTSTARRSH